MGGRLPGGAPKDHVADIGIVAINRDAGQHFVQQLAALADKGLAQPILLRAWSLPNQHQRRVGIAIRKHHVGGKAFEQAIVIALNGRPQSCQVTVRWVRWW